MSVTIPDYTLVNGVVHFQINTKLPLRSIASSKRYSDFLALRDSLCAESGISKNDFPYRLPPKSGVFASKETVAQQRKSKLAELLTHLVRDKEFQNSALLHRFLNVPPNFQFTADLLVPEPTESTDDKFLIPESALDIDKHQWLVYCRQLRSSINNLGSSQKLAERVANRDKYVRYLEPNMDKLVAALANLSDKNELSSDELRMRKALLTGIQEKLETVMASNSDSKTNPEASGVVNLSKRVFASPKAYGETEKTIDASNKELLLQQQQIHLDQDKEVEELRKIIARQRQMGEAINAEVEEQNEMLSTFSDEVDTSAAKVSQARGRARKIG